MKQSKNNGDSQAIDLICFSHLRWDFVFQRPQHLMSRAAAGRRVFFFEEPRIDSGPNRLELRPEESGVTVVIPWLQTDLSAEASQAELAEMLDQLLEEYRIDRWIAWYYTPMALAFSAHTHPALTVYDCMDELSAFNGAPSQLLAYEEELFRRADLVYTGGHSLYELKRERHPNVHPFPSSIDAAHFRLARKQAPEDEPIDQFAIPHPRLGFFGVLDERFDNALIAGLARARPEVHIVLVGPTAKVALSDLPRAANIHYLGSKSYKDLPRYLAGWDVAIMPFAQNLATRYISPTKTPEYLAGGKPVISTPIQDVVRPYGEKGLARIATGVEEWAAAVDDLLDSTWDRARWLKQVDAFLKQMSWDLTWKRMSALMGAALAEKEALVPVTGPGSNGRRGNGHQREAYDYLIVGAGYAGSILAERMAAGSGQRVLVIDRRSHIAGNAFDEYNPEGILIHRYGPHIFHTNSKEVFAYLSRFTEWRPYEHRVLASVDGQLVPIPINLDTINHLYGTRFTALDLEEFYQSVAENVSQVRTSEDVVISKVGRELYQKFFRNYTRKQWGLDPSELDASVTARVPVRFNRDDRYFTDAYQAMPLRGYTRLFENLLDHPNIRL
ncbi:MAG TPA: UDP-galactopyranose mutase, partial [Anaerolineaceae bacterium]|nr:UDP-galactopyranose mutase [Anaerolineaceae bacterium]